MCFYNREASVFFVKASVFFLPFKIKTGISNASTWRFLPFSLHCFSFPTSRALLAYLYVYFTSVLFIVVVIVFGFEGDEDDDEEGKFFRAGVSHVRSLLYCDLLGLLTIYLPVGVFVFRKGGE